MATPDDDESAGSAADKPLSAKHQRFVEEYLIDLNATAAYRRAGYAKANADVDGPRLLGTPRISRAVASAMAKRSQTTGITAERVLRELEVLAFSDHRDYLQDGTGVIQLREGVPEAAHRAISSVKRHIMFLPDGTQKIDVEFKLWDKPGMLRLAGKHVGIKGFADTLEVEGKGLIAPVIQVYAGLPPPPPGEEEEG